MKILIAYAGKSGTTEKCAKLLGEKLPGASVVNLNLETPEIGGFNTVIVGGSIRMGQLHKKAKNFIEQNSQSLKTKRTAYFICCGFTGNAPKLFSDNFSKELLDRAVDHECFGGEMKLENLHGFDRFIAGMVAKSGEGKNTPPPQISYENIGRMAAKIIGE